MRDFIIYCKNPVEEFKLSTQKLGYVLMIFFSLYILFIFVIAFSIICLQTELPNSSVRNMPTRVPMCFALFVPPLIEELSFRLWLRRNKMTVLISSICLIWLIVSMALPYTIYSMDGLALRCLIALSGGGFVLLFYKKIIKIKFSIVFYISASLFGLIHVYNYLSVTNILGAIYVFVLLMSHTLSGMFYGYVRIGYGFLTSFLFHVAHNLFPIIALYHQ